MMDVDVRDAMGQRPIRGLPLAYVTEAGGASSTRPYAAKTPYQLKRRSEAAEKRLVY